MPTKLYFRGNASVLAKGESEKLAIHYGPRPLRWLRRTAKCVAMNGHALRFRKRELVALEFQTDAEYNKNIEDQRRAAEERERMSHCRRCGADNPPEFDFCGHCGMPLVKREPKRRIPTGGN